MEKKKAVQIVGLMVLVGILFLVTIVRILKGKNTELRSRAGSMAQTYLYLSPENLETDLDDELWLSLKVDAQEEELCRVEVVLGYDSARLNLLDSWEEGNFGKWDWKEGADHKISIWAEDSWQGVGNLVRIPFRSVASGTAKVWFEEAIVEYCSGKEESATGLKEVWITIKD